MNRCRSRKPLTFWGNADFIWGTYFSLIAFACNLNSLNGKIDSIPGAILSPIGYDTIDIAATSAGGVAIANARDVSLRLNRTSYRGLNGRGAGRLRRFLAPFQTS
jgi:hypothetical protein